MSARRHIVAGLRGIVVLLFASAFLSRCASMMAPTGGPKDTLPPVIVNMTPDNFSTDRPTVGHPKIYIEFDEFVQLKDQQKEFFTSPQMKKKPTLTLRGRGVVIQLRDTLEANTTYALNFGSALRDNNEGNPLYSMRYVFSTGPEIDSMILSGYTADAYKADSVSKTFVWFFPADSVENVAEYDSTIFKYKPAVIARAENNGIFIAQNLKPVSYRVYAVQDKNDNQMYEPGTDQVGFLDGTYNPAELPDTIRGSVSYYRHDSVNLLQRVTEPLKLSWHFIETKEQQRKREKLERERRKAEEAGEEWTEPKPDNPFGFKLPLSGEVNPENHLTVDFDYPLARVDSAALLLTVTRSDKSVEDIPLHFVPDTASLRRWHLRAPWKPDGQYTLTIPEGAITDIAGFSNDSIVGKYTVSDPEKFATVKIAVEGRPGMQYIVQLLDGGGVLKQERRNVVSGPVQFNYVPPGEIKFRIIEDVNGNGRWDSGDVVARRQPERAEMFADSNGEETFATKANWDIEFTMDMGRIFAPVTMQSLSRLLDERELQRLRREEEKRAKEKPSNGQTSGSRSSDSRNGMNGMNGMGGMGGFGGMGGGLGSASGMFNSMR